VINNTDYEAIIIWLIFEIKIVVADISVHVFSLYQYIIHL